MLPGKRAFAVLMLAMMGSSLALAMESPSVPELAPGEFMVRILSPVAEPFPPSPYALPLRTPTRSVDDPDTAAKARLERHFSILSGKLRAVPGLVLITESTPGVPGVPYEIAIRLGADWQGVSIEARSASSPGGYRVLWRSNDAREPFETLSLTALWDGIPVENTDRDMENLVARMRLELFPPDRALLERKMSELRDANLDANQRRLALSQLLTADRRRDPSDRRSLAYRPDPVLINTALDVATTSSDPALRMQIWSMLVSVGVPRIDPAILIAPADTALAKETDPRVQLALVNTLATSSKDPQARAALESIANSDAEDVRPELVRMAARRVVNDSAGWNDYFVATLSDPRVPDAEKLELISYTNSISASTLRVGDAALKMNEAAERSLVNLVKGQGSPVVAQAAVNLLMFAGGAVARAEFVSFLSAGTGQSSADSKVRRSVLSALALSLRLHPEIRPLFEQVMSRDLDPAMREAARQALEQTM